MSTISRSLLLAATAGSWASLVTGQQCNSEEPGSCRVRVSREHQLLQLNRHKLVEARQGVPGDFSDRCASLHDVKRTCSSDGCKVLARNMRGQTCHDYCSRNDMVCIGAWEEQNNDCNVKATLTCEQTWPVTTDLICECFPGGTPLHGTPTPESKMELVWADEFSGSSVDQSKWTIFTGGGGFGNNELQYYTDHPANVHVGQGHLTITAKCEEYNGQHYTSAKLRTKGKGEWGPGHRMEVRARMPKGKGTWPAIWMLPRHKSYGNWPHSGEIDIMEAVGCTQGKAYGTVHTGAYNHMLHTEKSSTLPTDIGQWHTYAIEWTASHITWFLDDQLYHRFSPDDFGNHEKWPFNHHFYLILNLAVGGSWGGMCTKHGPSCSDSSEFGHPQVMDVDYARVYKLLS